MSLQLRGFVFACKLQQQFCIDMGVESNLNTAISSQHYGKI